MGNKATYWLSSIVIVYLGGCAGVARSQTPSPLQEWQYSSGLILEGMFEAPGPEVHAVLGLGAEVQPAYEGSRAYKVRAGPAIDVRYRDVAFVSTGDGVGLNLLHRRGLQVGISLAYDLGRKEREDYANLRGLGDKPMCAVPKAFAAWVVSDQFTLVLRADVRHLLRSGGGTVGDFGAYLPLPGSSAKFAAFLGPSVTLASRRYLRDQYGVSLGQSLASNHPVYDIRHSGMDAAGIGASATWRFSRHYLINMDVAINRLGREASDSPLAERASAHVLAISFDYQW